VTAKILIAIDGPSGCGKSTASHKLAERFQIPCIDTGAMYRTVAYFGILEGIDLEAEDALCALANRLNFRFGHETSGFYVESSFDGKPFERRGQEIRTPEVSMGASKVARLKKLRALLVSQQRKIGSECGGVIEGRDAGTVIFPNAPIKFYLTASTEERAKRRTEELRAKMGAKAPSYAEVLKDTKDRDDQDAQRAQSPMKPADDAIIIDTSSYNLDEVVQTLIDRVLDFQSMGSKTAK